MDSDVKYELIGSLQKIARLFGVLAALCQASAVMVPSFWRGSRTCRRSLAVSGAIIAAGLSLVHDKGEPAGVIQHGAGAEQILLKGWSSS